MAEFNISCIWTSELRSVLELLLRILKETNSNFGRAIGHLVHIVCSFSQLLQPNAVTGPLKTTTSTSSRLLHNTCVIFQQLIVHYLADVKLSKLNKMGYYFE
jgi:hypothetical protein